MLNAMGRGRSFTLIAVVMLATAPLLLIVTRLGQGWHEERLAEQEMNWEENAAEKGSRSLAYRSTE